MPDTGREYQLYIIIKIKLQLCFSMFYRRVVAKQHANDQMAQENCA